MERKVFKAISSKEINYYLCKNILKGFTYIMQNIIIAQKTGKKSVNHRELEQFHVHSNWFSSTVEMLSLEEIAAKSEKCTSGYAALSDWLLFIEY